MTTLADDLEEILLESEIKQNDKRLSRALSDDNATIALLQHARIIQSERANITIREALNENGASISTCAQVLTHLITNPQIPPDIRRRAVADALSLHNANALPIKQEPESPQINVTIQTSDRVNLATILNPSAKRQIDDEYLQ